MKSPFHFEIERKRAEWRAEHLNPGMPPDAVFRLIEQLVALYPQTAEAREMKCRQSQNIPEFIP